VDSKGSGGTRDKSSLRLDFRPPNNPQIQTPYSRAVVQGSRTVQVNPVFRIGCKLLPC
jgi:hypothetical protein